MLVQSGAKGSQFTRFNRTLVGWSNVKKADVLGFICSQKHEIYYQNVQQYEASEVVSAMSNVNEVGTAVVNVPTLQMCILTVILLHLASGSN